MPAYPDTGRESADGVELSVKPIKSMMVSHSDITGGAFIAAYRLHKALRAQGADSTLWVNKKASDDWTVKTHSGRLQQLVARARPAMGKSVANALFSDTDSTMRSWNWMPSPWPGIMQASDADLVHLQWYNAEMMSIKDVSRIKKPLIQTLHDMWAFCGAEHYAENDRWREGYSRQNRPASESGMDLDAYNWRSKKKHWKEPWQLVAVSHWLADCVRSSDVLSQFPIVVIPNPLDTYRWKPMDKHAARTLLNLPMDKKIITFGALAGTWNPRKGYDHLLKALEILKQKHDDIHIVIFGQSEPQVPTDTVFPTTYAGPLFDQPTLCALNSAADCYVNPAVQEAFGQTASEAQACGLPVVAFDDTGSCDVIEHQQTGYLAQLADAADLAHGIEWVLSENTAPDKDNPGTRSAISQRSTARAHRLFSYETVSAQYTSLYASVMESCKR